MVSRAGNRNCTSGVEVGEHPLTLVQHPILDSECLFGLSRNVKYQSIIHLAQSIYVIHIIGFQ